jgi:hypothetical protein
VASHLPAPNTPAQSVPRAPEPRPQPQTKPDPTPQPPVVPLPPAVVAVAPEPRLVNPDWQAAAPLPETRFDQVDIRLPFLRTVADFERDETRQELAAELARDPAFRIDVFTRNPQRAVELFRAAAKAAGVAVHADATTLKHLGQQHVNSVVIYTETLTPGETAALFGKLAAQDAKVSPHVFDALHAIPATGDDERHLRGVLGVHPGLFKRVIPPEEVEKPLPPGANGQSITDGTADHIVDTLKGKGKAGEKSGFLMTWSPLAARPLPGTSAELKAFLARRGERRPDAVPVVIVIRLGT